MFYENHLGFLLKNNTHEEKNLRSLTNDHTPPPEEGSSQGPDTPVPCRQGEQLCPALIGPGSFTGRPVEVPVLCNPFFVRKHPGQRDSGVSFCSRANLSSFGRP